MSSSPSASIRASHRQLRTAPTKLATPIRLRPSTSEAYDKDVSKFISGFGGTIPCTAEVLINYILVLAKRVAPATIARRCMAIQAAHIKGGHESPTYEPRVREALRAMVRGQHPGVLLEPAKAGRKPVREGAKQAVKKRIAKPLSRQLISRMFDSMGTGLRTLDRRDRAIVLLGFIAGLKRGAITALNIEDLEFTPDAMLIKVKKLDATESVVSSPSQERKIAVPVTRGSFCAASACSQWISHNDLEGKSGPLFPRFTRSGEPVLDARLDSAYISIIVKTRLKAAGIEDVSEYSGESLCRGHQLESPKSRRR